VASVFNNDDREPPHLPFLAEWLLGAVSGKDCRDENVGELRERFADITEPHERNRQVWRYLFRLIPSIVNNHWSPVSGQPGEAIPDAHSEIFRDNVEYIRVRRNGRRARPLIVATQEYVLYSEDLRYARLKRAVNLAGSSILLVASAPVFFAAALAIVVDDGFPIFFRQLRVGRFGRHFTMYKLRTMRKGRVDAMSPRITRVGYWLRKWSVDELPQLLNVLRGEMTFVGPRPEMPFIVNHYEPWQHLRHLVTPGITGLWQARLRTTVPQHLPEATMLDIEYVRRASSLTDALVFAESIFHWPASDTN
jgi:lipopolysaccharide/colanic/teichoic acid biosynthesis glycosyltransferase